MKLIIDIPEEDFKWINTHLYTTDFQTTKRLYESVRNGTPFDSFPDREKGEWIPVSERLPEMGVRVLCACQADLYDVLKLTPDGWFYDTRHTYMFGFVLAWQPLPEPYTRGKADEII